MEGLTKETFLKAPDPRNRDAMLYDMLDSIDTKVTCVKVLKKRIEKVEKKISYIKGIGSAITLILSVIIAWLAKVSGGQ